MVFMWKSYIFENVGEHLIMSYLVNSYYSDTVTKLCVCIIILSVYITILDLYIINNMGPYFRPLFLTYFASQPSATRADDELFLLRSQYTDIYFSKTSFKTSIHRFFC